LVTDFEFVSTGELSELIISGEQDLFSNAAANEFLEFTYCWDE